MTEEQGEEDTCEHNGSTSEKIREEIKKTKSEKKGEVTQSRKDTIKKIWNGIMWRRRKRRRGDKEKRQEEKGK